ncbi:MAG: UDP-N-acetylmuramate dehydrogenase, partial [Acidimicrobiales bacterium]
ARAVAGGDLGSLTTYRVGGRAALLVTVRCEPDLRVVASAVRASALPVLVVGRGSNLLVADSGFGGIAVVLDPEGFGRIEVDGSTVRAGAAVALPVLARQSVDAGRSGLEWAVGVPGSVGGAVRMNAGGHGSDTARTLRSCQVFDLEDRARTARRFDVADLEYAYRHSSVTPSQVVVGAELSLGPGNPAAGREAIREIVRWRREHQPGGQNAGSVFTNPPGNSAGGLVEAAGLKGVRWGSASVSTKHANFIQADPGGSADDVRALIEQVRQEVERTQGVSLLTEVRLVGFTSPSQRSGAQE